MEALDISAAGAPELDSGYSAAAEPADQPQPAGDTPPADPGASGEDGETGGSEPGEQTFFRAIENGRLSESAKTALARLKTESPPAYRAVTRALFAEQRLRQELPGGFKDIQQLRDRIEQLGGDTGIEETRQELNGFREFEALYSAADP